MIPKANRVLLLMALFPVVFLILAFLASVSNADTLGELGDAIDISHGTGDIAVSDVRCWVEEHGVKHIIVRAGIREEVSGGNHTRDRSKQQLRTLWQAKYEEGLQFTVDIYLYVHWPNNPAIDPPITTPIPTQVQEAIELLGELDIEYPLPVHRLWIDLEEAPPWCPDIFNDCDRAETVRLIREALNACGSFPCGIYTRKDWWTNYTEDTENPGNTEGATEFSNYPLWYALYDCPVNPTFSDFEPFGGWNEPFGKQYDKSDGGCRGDLCSKGVDYDIMYLSLMLADLEASGISFTSSPKPGMQTTVLAELINIGEIASGPFYVNWLLDGVPVGRQYHNSLRPGQVSTDEVGFSWTPTPGGHTLRFEADPEKVVTDPNQTNNSYQTTITVQDYADLRVSGITITPPPKPGVPTTAIVRLSNVGGGDSGTFSVKWFLDGTEVGHRSHSSLAPGEISRDDIAFDWIPTPGVHFLRFEADPGKQVPELKRNNNNSQKRLTVPDYPDLKVSSITFNPPLKVGVPTTAVARLSNAGKSASGVFAVKWFLDEDEVSYKAHSSLRPGQVSTDDVGFHWTPTPGNHTLRFEADVDNQVTESKKDNNSLEVPASPEGGRPDLKVSSITFDPPLKAGVLTTAFAWLSNVGQDASGTFNVKWFLNGVEVGYGYHTSLAPGQVSIDNVRFDWMPTRGVHTLRFEADVDKEVAESNEYNNKYQKRVTVTE